MTLTTSAPTTTVVLGRQPLSLEQFAAVARHHAVVEFAPEYVERVRASRAQVERFLAEERVVYGVTTGFGDNYRVPVSADQAAVLQRNLVVSHAVSVGEPLSEEVVRAIELMWLMQLGQGYSGTSFDTLDLIRELLNRRITAHVPGQGSVGYLGPEAHLARVLIGEGRVYVNGRVVDAAAALRAEGLVPVTLGAKEGLTLINGTHSVTAIGALLAYDAGRAASLADIAAAMSVEALKGTVLAFDARLHEMKHHPEQAAVAANMRQLLAGSEIADHWRDYRVQDPYMLRAIAQVHGGARRVLKDGTLVIEEEMQSLGDNPVILPDERGGVALMGANFDSTYVGLQADSMASALTVLAKIAERRIDRMVNSAFSELPAFLSPQPGLHNGYMIAQYTAAALYMEMKNACMPATVDSVPTSGNQEDPVSNAYLAVTKAFAMVSKLRYILAIEMLCAAQAYDLSASQLRGSAATSAVRQIVRGIAPPVVEDRFFGDEMEQLQLRLFDGTVLRAAREAGTAA